MIVAVAVAVAAVAVVVLAAIVLPRAADGPQLASASTRGLSLVVMTANVFRGQADVTAVLRLARDQQS